MPSSRKATHRKGTPASISGCRTFKSPAGLAVGNNSEHCTEQSPFHNRNTPKASHLAHQTRHWRGQAVQKLDHCPTPMSKKTGHIFHKCHVRIQIHQSVPHGRHATMSALGWPCPQASCTLSSTGREPDLRNKPSRQWLPTLPKNATKLRNQRGCGV